MNKEQWICLVGGLGGIFIPVGQELWQFGIIAVLIITGGLIYRFRDKPKDKEKEGTEE